MTTRLPHKRLLLLTAAIMACLLLVACGSDDNDSSDTPTPTPSQGSDNSGAGTNTPTAEPTNSGGGEPDILDELQTLGGDMSKVTAKVAYTNTSTDGTTSTMTYYAKEGKTRLDYGVSDANSTIIEVGATTYVCDPGTETCISYSGAVSGGIGLSFLTLFSSHVDDLVSRAQTSGIPVSKSDEEIAGVDATCYSGEDEVHSGKFCFNAAGVMVYQEWTDANGTFKLEAKDISDDVSDSDFEPLYKVTAPPS